MMRTRVVVISAALALAPWPSSGAAWQGSEAGQPGATSGDTRAEAQRPLTYAEYRLRDAIVRNDADRVRRLVAEGASVTATVEGVELPLVLAVGAGDLDLVDFFLSLGAGGALSNGEWYSLIDAAVARQRSDLEIFRRVITLMPEGADIAKAAPAAVMYGREAELRVLLESGIDPLAALPPLEFKEGPRRLLSVARLFSLVPLSRGAAWRVLAPDYAEAALRGHPAAAELGITPLMAAAFRGDADMVARLLADDPASAAVSDADGWTAVHWAAAGTASAALVQRLLDAGGAAEGPGEPGDFPLAIAAASGNAAAARGLLAGGASIVPPDHERDAVPLTVACRFGNAEVARVLMDAAGTLAPDTRRAMFSAAALEAATFQQWPLVLTLLEAGADPNFRGGVMKSTSIVAAVAGAASGGSEVVDALFAAGNDEPAERATSGWWPMEQAIRAGNAEVFTKLVARIKDRGERAVYVTGRRMLDEALGLAASYRRAGFVRELIAAGADVNAPGINGSTALYFASGSGSSDIVRLLLEHGADPNGAGEAGNLPLTAAASVGTGEVIELLLAAGATLEARGRDGLTPLQTAAGYGNVEAIRALLRAGALLVTDGRGRPIVQRALSTRPWSSEAIRALVEGGADVNATDIGGVTALDVAEAVGDARVISTLIELGGRRGQDLR